MAEQNIDGLKADFDRASRRLSKGLGTKEGGGGAEKEYAIAYNRLADAGVPGYQRLRPKYRG